MSLLIIQVDSEQGVIAVTDSIAYNFTTGDTGWTSKVTPLPHLDAMVTGVGSKELVLRYLKTVDWAGRRDQSLDDVIADTQQILTTLWADMDELNADIIEEQRVGVVYLCGWSPVVEEYVVVRFHSAEDFEPDRKPDGLMIYPPPHHAENITAPASFEEWAALAEFCRTDQRDHDGPRILIGGRVLLTNLTRGYIGQTTIHEYANDPEEWDRYFDGLGLNIRHPPRAGDDPPPHLLGNSPT